MKHAFIKSIPILCSYVFVSMAYGIMMEEAGFHWYYSLLVSLTVYTGAFQFVLITFLSSGASILTIALTAFLMNSRQSFYSLTFIDEFKNMGKRLPYMIHTMTDETYAVNLTLETEYQEEVENIEKMYKSADETSDVVDKREKKLLSAQKKKQDSMFFVALFSRCYWMFGAVLGGVLGQLIPFELKGIDFCMTALFVIIFIDQWEKSENHMPALLGLLVAVLSLCIFGSQHFMLVALIVVSGILLLIREKDGKEECSE